MIYFTTTDHKHVVILEPTNLVSIEAGKPAASPDSMVIIAYCPDIVWFAERLRALLSGGNRQLQPSQLEELLKEGLQRPRKERNDKESAANVTFVLEPPGKTA